MKITMNLIFFWINGISKNNFMNNLLIFSIIVMIIQIFIGSYISPSSQHKGRELLKNSNIDYFTGLIKQGKFINAAKNLTIFTEKKDNNNFSDIFIDDSTKNISRLIYAKNGIIISENKNKKFVLFNGKVINIDRKKINTFEFDQIDFSLNSLSTNTIIKPKIQELSSSKLIKCILNLNFFSNEKCENISLNNQSKEELLKRFYKPIYIPLISILCCLLLSSGNNRLNYNAIKKFVFLLVFLFLIISETTLRYSTETLISLIIYFLIPFLSICFAYFIIKKRFRYA